jgi:hypothetical protein
LLRVKVVEQRVAHTATVPKVCAPSREHSDGRARKGPE